MSSIRSRLPISSSPPLASVCSERTGAPPEPNVQGAILLIAAKRQDQISSELALHDYQTNVEADEIVKAIHTLTTELHQKICAPEAPTS